jgi:IstB-like ATP binding protein
MATSREPLSETAKAYWQTVAKRRDAFQTTQSEPSKAVCPDCGGSGWREWLELKGGATVPVPMTTTGRLMAYDYPGASVTLQMCECRARAIHQARVEAVLDGRAGIPEEWRGCTFDSWLAMPKEWRIGKSQAFEAAALFADGDIELADGQIKRGLVMAGPTGRGKSGLAAAVMLERSKHGQNCLWIDFRQFLRKAYSTIRRDQNSDDGIDYEALIGTAASVDLLVWDDFADSAQRSAITDYVRNVVYDVIGERHREHRATLITTNLTVDQMYTQFDDRIGDRVLQMCHWQALDDNVNLRFAKKE